MRRIFRRLRDLWIYFKTGHSTYLTFIMGLFNFVVIQYRLVISTIPAFSSWISSLSIFAVMFVVTYAPIAILLGRFEYAKGEITRRPKLNIFNQDRIASDLLLRKALVAHFEEDNETAKNLIVASSKRLEKWIVRNRE